MVNKSFGVNDLSVSGTSSLNFTQSGTGAIQRTVDNKLKDVLDVRDFGAVCDGVTNDLGALQAAIAAATALAASSGNIWPEIDLGGLTCAVTDTLVLGSSVKVVLKSGTIKAIGTWDAGKHVLDNQSNFQPRFSQIVIDADFKAGCLKLTKRARLEDVQLRAFNAHDPVNPTYGLWNEGGVNSVRLQVNQWNSQPGFDVQANRTGIGIYTNTADSQFLDTVTSRSMIPLLIGSSALFNRFSQLHTFNGSGSANSIHNDPINIKVEDGVGKILIQGLYCDNGTIDLYSDNVVISGVVFLYNSSRANYASHFKFYATASGATLSRFFFDNYLANTGLPLFAFIDNGFNWSSNVSALASQQDGVVICGSNETTIYRGTTGSGVGLDVITSNANAFTKYTGTNTTTLVMAGAEENDYAIRTNGITRLRVKDSSGSLDGANNVITNYRYNRVGLNAGQVIGDTYSLAVISINSASAETFTLDANASTGTTVKFVQRGTGTITLAPGSGATINGTTANRTLTQYLGCTATVHRNSDNTSAEWTLEGTFT